MKKDARSALALYGIELLKESTRGVTLKLKSGREVKLSSSLFFILMSALKNAERTYIKLPPITYGVELEFVGSVDDSIFESSMMKYFKNRYHNYGSSYSNNSGLMWILGNDRSIKYESSENNRGYELSTPKLRLFNNDDVEDLNNAIKFIKNNLHGEINDSCGTHIHISFPSCGLTRQTIRCLLSSYSKMEYLVFDPIVPKSRRNNTYCRSTVGIISTKYQKLSARYCKFNEKLVCEDLHLEIRQLEGTLDLKTILNWLYLQVCIIYDIVRNSNNVYALKSITSKNILEILFRYDFDSDFISFYIERLVDFKSRSIQINNKLLQNSKL